MSYYRGDADIAVIGAGHAGIEAGLAGARLGLHTLVFTINLDAVGNMPCNPSIGGTGKGQLVHEIDAMGGEMGRVADTVTLQSRILNRGKGPAVHSSRIQADRRKYQDKMKKILENTDNLELIQAEIVRVGIEGGKVTEPSIPKKDKHRFDGWYLDGKLWDFQENKVTNSITLTAKWVEVVTVTFDLGDGTTIPVTVDKNQPVAKISDPSKNGFLFCAWRDSNGTEWNFNTIVTEDITLTAFWLEACVVSFDTDGAGEMASVIVDKGELLEVPTPPNRGEQWRIRGWYYGDVEWNFATDKVTTNITLKAKWVIQTPVDSFE